MGIFQQFPYSNFHEMNLDQIIKIMREMQDEWANTKAEWASYKDFIDNYFENLDVSAEVLEALRIFAADGTLNQIMDPTIASETAAWLADHITQPTVPAIDTSLTVAGAAADAKVTGDRILIDDQKIKALGGLSAYPILNNITWEQGTVDGTTGARIASNTRIRTVEYIEVEGFNNITLYTSDNYKIGINMYDSNMQIKPAYNPGWLTRSPVNLAIPSDVKYIDLVGAYITDATIDPSAYTHFDATGTYKSVKELNGIINDTLYAYTADNLPVEDMTAALTNTDWYWINDHEYPAGYVHSVRVKGTAQSDGKTAYVAFIDPDTGKLLFRSVGLLVGDSLEVTIPCNIYIDKSFYLGVCLPYLAHRSAGSTVHWARIWQPALWEAGAIIPIAWEASTGTYKWAAQVNYQSYSNMHNMEYKRQLNKVFVAGDSITAGYPYTTGISSPYYPAPDIRYGAVYERLTGNPVTFAASSGSGWLYRTAPDAQYAISIADNTDFSDYDAAVFAFGTNDYGNNMALGSVNDLYPGQNTVCGAINYVLERIRTTGASCTPILILPIVRTDHGNLSTKFAYGSNNSAGYSLGALCDRIIEICEKWDVPYIDPRCSCPLNARTASGLLVDTLHPSIVGYKKLSPYLAGKIAETINTYPLSILQQNH